MSFELPSNSLSQAELDASNKSPIYVAVAVGFALATGGVILRFLARRKSEATFGWDDYAIIFALVSSPASHFIFPLLLSGELPKRSLKKAFE